MPLEKPKPQPFINFDSNKFSTYSSLFKIESNTATQWVEQHDSINEEIEAEIKSIFATENLNAETDEDQVLDCGSQTRKKNLHLASFAKKYHAALSERLFSEDGILYEEKRN